MNITFKKLTKNRKLLYLLLFAVILLLYSNIFVKTPQHFAIKTVGCHIPNFKTYLLHLIQNHYKPKCSQTLPELIHSDLNTIYVHPELFPDYKIHKRNKFQCCYQEIIDQKNNTYTLSKKCIWFKSLAVPEKEYVRVICKYKDEEIYRDYYSFVPLKKAQTNKLNVLVIGIHGTSRLNLHRQMPKTVSYLRELNAIEFLGYNKIGENTIMNIIPALTGDVFEAFNRECIFPSNRNNIIRLMFDCNLIWGKYKKAGYLTAFAEDASHIGLFDIDSLINYNWNIFEKAMVQDIGYNPSGINEQSDTMCVKRKFTYQKLLEYLEKFLETLKNEAYFGWFWQNSLTQVDMNYLSVADEDYENIFRIMNNSGVLDDTVVFFLSDHGPKYGESLYTHQGYMESRLPFLYVLVPQWFKEEYPEKLLNLMDNSERLITAFDVHETFEHILQIKKPIEDIPEIIKRGISLFEPIPEGRTCSSLGIPSEWCTCLSDVPIIIDQDKVQHLAEYVVAYMNNLLRNYKECECVKFTLDNIIEARLLVLEDLNNKRKNPPSSTYVIIMKTQPENAIYENIIKCTHCLDPKNFKIKYTTTNRLNKIENEEVFYTSPEEKLRSICLCVKQEK